MSKKRCVVALSENKDFLRVEVGDDKAIILYTACSTHLYCLPVDVALRVKG